MKHSQNSLDAYVESGSFKNSHYDLIRNAMYAINFSCNAKDIAGWTKLEYELCYINGKAVRRQLSPAQVGRRLNEMQRKGIIKIDGNKDGMSCYRLRLKTEPIDVITIVPTKAELECIRLHEAYELLLLENKRLRGIINNSELSYRL